MDEEKKFPFDVKEEGVAPRARNRTVMLTPEMTGQVRARLAQETTGALPESFSPNITAQQAPRPAAPQSTAAPVAGVSFHSGKEFVWTKDSKLIGFMVSFDRNEFGEFYPLKVGRLIITSEVAASGGNYLLLSEESVSPMHAIMRISQNGEVQILDQLSEYGTKIKHTDGSTEELSGEKSILSHGDIVSFGDRSFHILLIP